MFAKKSFAGKNVVITGAASGIGRATALEFARQGARLALVDIDPSGVAAAAQEIRAIGGEALPYVVDVASAPAIAEFAARVQHELPQVDILVNNAGVAVIGPFARSAPADWEWIYGVNVLGPIQLTRALLPAMLARGSGHVVIVASLAGMVAYSTTKFALVGFAEALRFELAESGVGVTAVCPGFVRTGLHRATRYDNPGFRRFLDQAPSYYGISKEHVAKKLVAAVTRQKPLVVLGPEKLGWWLKRLAPEVSFAIAKWTARRTDIL